ncbi:hypothetical protein ACIA8R_33575 [Nonomuraea sp. NPDC051191]|uniref:hypothetical protein n=1 Tax=Nonomuraea sp. NPDC051191 TaxID=3364372 RepID=UPI0037A6F676
MAIRYLRARTYLVLDENVARLSPSIRQHINAYPDMLPSRYGPILCAWTLVDVEGFVAPAAPGVGVLDVEQELGDWCAVGSINECHRAA